MMDRSCVWQNLLHLLIQNAILWYNIPYCKVARVHRYLYMCPLDYAKWATHYGLHQYNVNCTGMQDSSWARCPQMEGHWKRKKISIYIYIKANLAGWTCLFVCMLLGSGGLLLCSGGVFFGVRSGGDIFDIYYCCYAAGGFSLGSVLGPLLGNDIYIKSSLFFGVCSGAVAWQRQ
jgi:hypothetical protein